MDISELLLTQGKNGALISLYGHLNALYGPNAARRQISVAPGQSDQSSAEATRPAPAWRICIDPSVGGHCRSLRAVL